jgi:hypothetical protein
MNAMKSKTEIFPRDMEGGLLHTLNHDAPSLSMSARLFWRQVRLLAVVQSEEAASKGIAKEGTRTGRGGILPVKAVYPSILVGHKIK